jgi:hypothetical protein
MGVRVRRWHLLAGAVAVVVLVAGAVLVWPDGPDDPPPPAAKQARPKPVLKPLRLAATPRWTSEGLDITSRVASVDMIGETMVVQDTIAQIHVVDMVTGTVLHVFGLGDDITGRGGERLGDAAVTTSGLIMSWASRGGCDTNGECDPAQSANGLALVSPTDGRTVWEKTVSPATDQIPPPPHSYTTVVTDDVVLVSVGGAGSVAEPEQPPLRTIALDVRTGATLWESQDPLWPQEVVGDTIVGRIQVAGATTWTVGGADLRTGLRTWSRPADLDESSVEGLAGDVVLLRGRTAGGSDRLVFVDAATGRTITELDDVWHYTSCGDDDLTLIVCAGPDKTSDADKAAADDDQVVLFRVDKRTTTTELVDYGSVVVVGGWSGRAQLSGRLHGNPKPQMFTMDVLGNVIDKDLRAPGGLVRLTADEATFITPDFIFAREVEVYEVVH